MYLKESTRGRTLPEGCLISIFLFFLKPNQHSTEERFPVSSRRVSKSRVYLKVLSSTGRNKCLKVALIACFCSFSSRSSLALRTGFQCSRRISGITRRVYLKVASMDSIAFFRSSSSRTSIARRLISSFSRLSLMRPSASANAFSL
jgi:hypothetical protein